MRDPLRGGISMPTRRLAKLIAAAIIATLMLLAALFALRPARSSIRRTTT